MLQKTPVIKPIIKLKNNRDNIKNSKTPGPGQYNIENVIFKQKKTIKSSSVKNLKFGKKKILRGAYGLNIVNEVD